MFADTSKDLIVITTESKWDETPRMRHYIAHQLSRFFNVLFIEIHSNGLPKIKKVTDTLMVHRLGGYIKGSHRFRLAKNINDTIQSYLVGAHTRKYNVKNIILLNFRFDFWQVYTHSIFKLRYFFLNDDFVNMSPTDTTDEKERKRNNQNKVVELSHRVFASSEPLAEDVLVINERVSVIHSGHDFSPENNNPKSKSDKIRVCFMGFVHGSLELGWIERLAQEENIQITFVGPIESLSTHERLMKHKNIAFHPPLIGVKLQVFISQFDVFIMPYTSDEVNLKATVPAKLFQYLACGRPVVSSLMPHLLSLPDKFVYQSCSADDFVHSILKAHLEDTVDLFDKRIAYATEHSWNRRGDEMLEIIRQDLKLNFS